MHKLTFEGGGIFFTQPYWSSICPCKDHCSQKTPTPQFQEQFSIPSPSDHILKWFLVEGVRNFPFSFRRPATLRRPSHPKGKTGVQSPPHALTQSHTKWRGFQFVTTETLHFTCHTLGFVKFSCCGDMHFPDQSEVLTTSMVKSLLASSLTNYHLS